MAEGERCQSLLLTVTLSVRTSVMKQELGDEKMTLHWFSHPSYQTESGGMVGSNAATQLLLLACMDLPAPRTWGLGSANFYCWVSLPHIGFLPHDCCSNNKELWKEELLYSTIASPQVFPTLEVEEQTLSD